MTEHPLGRSALSHSFEECWRAARPADALMPGRSDFSLADFSDFLPKLSMLEISEDGRNMPILMAGSDLNGHIGFELTGMDFLEFDANAFDPESIAIRLAYHDHPAGRFDCNTLSFPNGLKVLVSFTGLPLLGKSNERQILVLVEYSEPSGIVLSEDESLIEDVPDHTFYIDIGAGIPSYGRDDRRELKG